MQVFKVLPREFAKYEKKIMDLEVFDDDIWISSFPKCGTTWTQEMVWNIVNNLDFEAAKRKTLDLRVPFLELSGLVEERIFENMNEQDKAHILNVTASLDFCGNLTRPRIIKTHLDYEMLPRQVKDKKPKLIYVTRNPRDVVVSSYNHWKALNSFTGNIHTIIISSITWQLVYSVLSFRLFKKILNFYPFSVY